MHCGFRYVLCRPFYAVFLPSKCKVQVLSNLRRFTASPSRLQAEWRQLLIAVVKDITTHVGKPYVNGLRNQNMTTTPATSAATTSTPDLLSLARVRGRNRVDGPATLIG